ncbi:MAG TPA: universal stress protein [Gaiellaceae bacterium]|nr:universal stress protein [Gaiellaceae bacterium]
MPKNREHRLVIATDGSPGAREALETGLALARESGAFVTFVYVRHGPSSMLGSPLYQRSLSEEMQHARSALAEAEELALEVGVESEAEIVEGHPAERVIELAAARDADLIVVGSRGRGGIAGALLGSVSTELVQKADRPVLVCKQRSGARSRAA